MSFGGWMMGTRCKKNSYDAVEGRSATWSSVSLFSPISWFSSLVHGFSHIVYCSYRIYISLSLFVHSYSLLSTTSPYHLEICLMTIPRVVLPQKLLSHLDIPSTSFWWLSSCLFKIFCNWFVIVHRTSKLSISSFSSHFSSSTGASETIINSLLRFFLNIRFWVVFTTPTQPNGTVIFVKLWTW